VTVLAAVVAQFAMCAAVILWSGVRLSRYGDVIAEKSGLGGTWVGLVMLATVTSLPELVTGASAVLIFDVPDIAAGDAIGSCMFNLVILALLDWKGTMPLSARVHQGHVLSAGFGMLLLSLVALAIVAGPRAPAVGWIGVHSLVLLGVYLLAVRTLFAFERARQAQVATELGRESPYHHLTLQRAVTHYAIAAVVLVAAASLLPGIAERLAAATGLDQSFVGTLFVAISTSLPEVVVSVAAAGIGALDMAAANLFGSNLFNVAVIALDDVMFVRGPLLQHVSPAHVAAALGAVAMTAVAVVGLTYRASRKRFRLSWDSIAIIALYVISVALLHALS
jgi:cation:H+ antiporter